MERRASPTLSRIYSAYSYPRKISLNICIFIRFGPRPYNKVAGATVHTGFYTSYAELKDDFMKTLMQYLNQYKTYKLTVTGHSLGGLIYLAFITIFKVTCFF